MRTIEESAARRPHGGDRGAAKPGDPAPAAPAGPRPARGVAEDRAFEAELLSLVSRLEQTLATLDDAKGPGRNAVATRIARVMIEQVFMFSSEKFQAGDHVEAFEKGQLAYEAAKALEEDYGRLPSPRGLGSYFRRERGEDPKLSAAYMRVGQVVRGALAAYFLLFAESFREPAKSKQWLGAFQVFVEDFKKRW
jgi:hypothetical protein